MQQRGALGDAGGAAGILQEGDIVRRDRNRLEAGRRSGLERGAERNMAGQRPGRHHFLDLAHDQVDQQTLDAEQVAHGGHDDVLDRRARNRGLQRRGEVLQDDDRLGAGILKLVFQFARRIERVDVHDDAAGAQNTHHRDRILQHVRHHYGDARTLGEPLRLQEGRERRRVRIEFAVAHRPCPCRRRPDGPRSGGRRLPAVRPVIFPIGGRFRRELPWVAFQPGLRRWNACFARCCDQYFLPPVRPFARAQYDLPRLSIAPASPLASLASAIVMLPLGHRSRTRLRPLSAATCRAKPLRRPDRARPFPQTAGTVAGTEHHCSVLAK